MRKFKKNTETKKQKTTPYGRGVQAIDWSKVDPEKLQKLSFVTMKPRGGEII